MQMQVNYQAYDGRLPQVQRWTTEVSTSSTLEEIYSNSDRAIIDFAKESGFLNLL